MHYPLSGNPLAPIGNPIGAINIYSVDNLSEIPADHVYIKSAYFSYIDISDLTSNFVF